MATPPRLLCKRRVPVIRAPNRPFGFRETRRNCTPPHPRAPARGWGTRKLNCRKAAIGRQCPRPSGHASTALPHRPPRPRHDRHYQPGRIAWTPPGPISCAFDAPVKAASRRHRPRLAHTLASALASATNRPRPRSSRPRGVAFESGPRKSCGIYQSRDSRPRLRFSETSCTHADKLSACLLTVLLEPRTRCRGFGKALTRA